MLVQDEEGYFSILLRKLKNLAVKTLNRNNLPRVLEVF